MYNLVLTEDDMNKCLNALRGCEKLVYDVETSGLNFRKNHIVGHVLTVGPRPEDTFYVPVRHKGLNNCLNKMGLLNEEDKRVELHPFEIEFAKIAPAIKIVVGHNLGFDLLFAAAKGIFFGGRTECTQTAMALINEHLPSFSLDACAKYMRVTQKLGDELYFHLAKMFGGEPDKKQMKNFWRLEGNDTLGVDYSTGDGVSTWELREAQEKEIIEQNLQKVWDVECRVTKTLFRMQYAGIKIDENELGKMSENVKVLIEEAKNSLPAGLNINSAKQIKAWFDMEGIKDYPITEKGNASFTAEYLDTNEPGQRILKVRKLTTLIDRFVTPLIEEHLINGRISPNYNQLRGDDFGTITGRLSCNNPNIQQVYKRDKWLGKIFRKVFIPDESMQWASLDFSQCEPRIYTSYSKSKILTDGYLANPPVDFYQTLSNITGIPRSPTAGVAGNCKQLALAIFYGAGIPKTAVMLGVSIERAKEIRSMVQLMCPEIKIFADDAQRRAKARGYVMTALGRRARFPNGEYAHKAAGRIVQGGNADLIKLTLVEVDDYLISQGLPPPIATVHDSIEVQVPVGRQDIVDEVARIMNSTAQGDLINFSIPQKVDVGIGKNWAIATYGEE